MVPSRASEPRGISLIDVIVGSALVLLIFTALVGILRASIAVSAEAKAKAGATAIAESQMEYVRSLSYDSVGTVGGIPAGTIAQNATTTLNGIPYGVRTFIDYYDDPADGTGASDTNGITTDYKRIKIAVTYAIKGATKEIDLLSNYAPPSIETTNGGGTLRISVVNSTGAPVAGAAVEVVDASTSPAVDVTTFSDSTGTVLFGGAATSTEYQVYVSKTGYSSAQTYTRDTTNQNPTPGYLTVAQNQTTTSTFAIDLLSLLTLSTFYPILPTSTTDTFSDASELATQSNTVVTGSALTLASGGSGYVSSGSARSVAIGPSYLAGWTSASTTLTTPGGTTALIQVADGSGTLLPDGVLPGNSTGFSGSSIDLSSISTTTYPSLSLVANLTTSATTSAPAVTSWSVNALAGPTPIPNVAFTLSGAKTIGSTGAGAPIYKTSALGNTDSTGSTALSLEWDSYNLALSGYDVIDACTAPPFALAAGTTNTALLYLGSQSTNEALITVTDSTGALVPGASVTLSRSGYSSTVTTSSCGTAYFGGISSASDYTVQIAKSGYTTTSTTNVSISGQTFYDTSFP